MLPAKKQQQAPKSLANYVSKAVYDGKRSLTPTQVARLESARLVSESAIARRNQLLQLKTA